MTGNNERDQEGHALALLREDIALAQNRRIEMQSAENEMSFFY